MTQPIQCPRCQSQHITQRNIGKRAGSTIGAVDGGIQGATVAFTGSLCVRNQQFSRQRARHDRAGGGRRHASSAEGSSLPAAFAVADQAVAQHS